MEIYRRLLERYGPQGWWPGDGPFETMVGAILAQNTAWRNVERALTNLKAAGVLSPGALRSLPEEELARLVRPSGYFLTKARKLKALVAHLARYGDDLAAMFRQDTRALREELLGIWGIGDETADAIVLYAAGLPSFVIDSYTRRILDRLGLMPERRTYAGYQALFHDHLTRDALLYNEYHALLDRHAKATCRKTPLCSRCCLLETCPTGARVLASS